MVSRIILRAKTFVFAFFFVSKKHFLQLESVKNAKRLTSEFSERGREINLAQLSPHESASARFAAMTGWAANPKPEARQRTNSHQMPETIYHLALICEISTTLSARERTRIPNTLETNDQAPLIWEIQQAPNARSGKPNKRASVWRVATR